MKIPKNSDCYNPKIHEDLSNANYYIIFIIFIEIFIDGGGKLVPCIAIAYSWVGKVQKSIEKIAHG